MSALLQPNLQPPAGMSYMNPSYGAGSERPSEMSATQVGIWRKRIQRSMRAKDELGLYKLWTVLDAYYEGKYFKQLSKKHQIATNWMFSILRQTLAALYFQNPTFYMRGLTELGRMAAPVMEQVYAAEREVMDAEESERNFLLYGLKKGIGIMKHGYSAAVSPEMPLRGPNPIQDEGDTESELYPLAPRTEFDQRVHYGHAWQMEVDPRHFFMDADAKVHSEAGWYCHRYYRKFVDVRDDIRLSKAARFELKPSGRSSYFNDEKDLQKIASEALSSL